MDIEVNMDPVTLTEEELQDLCREWQQTLRLQDWDIYVYIVRARNMSDTQRLGEVEWDLNKKSAVISILDPVDCPDNLVEPQDMELTLVHELTHLPIALFDRSEYNSPEYTAMEQAVHYISKALVNLKRK